MKTLQQDKFSDLVSEHSLFSAWTKVASHSSSPGTDGMTVERFSRNYASEISKLHEDILSGRYQPSPLMIFSKKKKDTESFRELAIPCMRDKILARALSDQLISDYDSQLAPQSYAYRPRKSAVAAVAAVQSCISRKKPGYAVRIDVKEFFDSMDHAVLGHVLHDFGLDRRTLNLVMAFAKNRRFDGVKIYPSEVGVPQGIPLAPVVSNMYLDGFDKVLSATGASFVRYADDMVLFAEDADEAGNFLNLALRELGILKLSHSVNKTRIYRIDDGFIFLGFVFNRFGKAPSKEAIENLSAKLRQTRLDDESMEEYEKRREAIERGWRNYFEKGADKSVDSSVGISKVAQDIPEDDPHSEVPHERIDGASKEENGAVPPPELGAPSASDTGPFSYSEFVQQMDLLVESGRISMAATKIRRVISDEDIAISRDQRRSLTSMLADSYEKLGLSGAAAACRHSSGRTPKPLEAQEHFAGSHSFSAADVSAWMDIFGSDQTVFNQFVDSLGRHGYKPAPHKLTPNYLESHWRGASTISVQVADRKGLCRFAVLDFDVSRKSIEELPQAKFEKIRQDLLLHGRSVQDKAFKSGLNGILEDSGYKGYHLWFFFSKPLSAEFASEFLKELVRISPKPPEGAHVELFPVAAKIAAEDMNSRIKMPLGLHRLSGRRSAFLMPDGSPVARQIQFISTRSARNQESAVRKAMAAWRVSEKYRGGGSAASGRVSELLSKCNMLNAIRGKAESEKFLSHYERIVIRGILSPLGEEGVAEIHRILSNCDNYSRKITDKMLSDRRDHFPMACHKIREILGDSYTEVQCSCSFKKRAGQYSHPLRHLDAAPVFDVRNMQVSKPRLKPAKNSDNPEPVQPKEIPQAPVPSGDYAASIEPEIIKPAPSQNIDASCKGRDPDIQEHKGMLNLNIKLGSWSFSMDFGKLVKQKGQGG